jgi:hypothetical protein
MFGGFLRTFKVGGVRFLRIGRLQASFCVCSNAPKRRRNRAARNYATYSHGFRDGYNEGPAQGWFDGRLAAERHELRSN